ncbi:TPA_asm: PLA2X [Hydra adintovirus]|nr:TPA_asm: PLA2X [Hydra adintovirus]
MYCVKCRKETDTINLQHTVSKNNRNMLRGNCAICGTTKCKFTKGKSGGDLVDSLNKLTKNIKFPLQKFKGEMHLPKTNFLGPNTAVEKRLNPDDSPKEWSMPVDRVDNAAYHHDLAYKHFPDVKHRNIADKMMIEEMDAIQNPTLRERLERKIVKPIIKAKVRFGLGVNNAMLNNSTSIRNKEPMCIKELCQKNYQRTRKKQTT